MTIWRLWSLRFHVLLSLDVNMEIGSRGIIPTR